MDEVCTGVGIEPPLQQLDNEVLKLKTANREDGARIDILAEDFRVLSKDHSFTSGCSTLWLLAYVPHQSQAYTDCQKEKEKRRHYME